MSSKQTFDYSVDLIQHLLWQYNDAENLPALLQAKQDWYDVSQEDFWNNWFRDVFNLDTVNSFGISVWAVILNIPLFEGQEPISEDFPTFGFGPFNKNFNNGRFVGLTDPIQMLTLEEKRILLKFRYFQLTTDMTLTAINQFMADIFGMGVIFVTDGLNMTITYSYTNAFNPNLLTVMQEFELFPRPAGVSVTFMSI